MLTQAQWLAKLKGWVPSWFFQDEKYQQSHFDGLAAILAQIDSDAQSYFQELFIKPTGMTGADSVYLDMFGFERTIPRLPQESDAVYAGRIQTLLNQSNPVAILAAVNALLINGPAFLQEHGLGEKLFCNESYLNRGEVLTYISFNTFSLVIPRQLHAPFSFMSRGYFCNESYVGSNQSSQTVFDLIVETVNNLKAAGVLYRVFERTS
jgi:hypothetical protein